MSDHRDAIQAMFSEAHRYANFGNMLMRMHVRGFRCHSNTIVEIARPITAFCGLNGTGKSTLLQLAAAAYSNPAPSLPYYIKDFLVVGTLDSHPFTDEATVEYRFWQEDRSLRPLTFSRNAATKRWQGYARRLERRVLFAGIGLYLPKIEQRDFIVRNASQLTLSDSTAVSNQVREWTCRILGLSYDQILSNTVTYSRQTGKVVSVQRAGITYSEAHMGYGEGRSQSLISMVETLPDRSLVLIEEPETSLHPSAQFEFGQYLIDVVKRKRHQILLTTHSEFILKALPSQSRVFLAKTDAGIRPIVGLTALQAKSLMTDGRVKALNIFVEDKCAGAILSEFIRRIDPDFLKSVGIYPAGDSNAIAAIVRTLQPTELPVAAVRDADKNSVPRENIFKLPGSLPPEKELFACDSVKAYILTNYGVNLSDFSVSLMNTDHHEWFRCLADCLSAEEPFLLGETARVYARGLPESEASSLVTLLKEASRK